MMLNKNNKKEIVKHILETVFDLPSNSDLHKALLQNGLFSIEDVLCFPDQEYHHLEFEDKEMKKVTLKRGTINIVKAFKVFVAF